MTEVYAEAGIGNGTFFSTEYEEGEKEWRVPRFEKPKKVYGYYIRIWVFKHMFAFTTYEGMKYKKKNRNTFKLLFGIGGEV